MSVHRALRSAVYAACDRVGVLERSRRRMRSGLTILMYHRVVPDEQWSALPLPDLAIPESAFRAQVRLLSDWFDVVPVRCALAALGSDARGDAPLVSITFDDGYADNHALARPILADHGVRATFFITAGFIGTDGVLWHDRAAGAFCRLGADALAARLGVLTTPAPPKSVKGWTVKHWLAWLKQCSPRDRDAALAAVDPRGDEHCGQNGDRTATGVGADRMMGWDQVGDLLSDGHEIGSHSLSHALLPQLDDAALEREVVESRRLIESRLGTAVAGLAYPNGDHDGRVVQAARRAGYQYACTTAPGLNVPECDRFGLLRIDIAGGRVVGPDGAHDSLAFEAEVCHLKRLWSTRRGRP